MVTKRENERMFNHRRVGAIVTAKQTKVKSDCKHMNQFILFSNGDPKNAIANAQLSNQ